MSNECIVLPTRRAAAAACLLVVLCAGADARAGEAAADPWWRPDAAYGQIGIGEHVKSTSIGAAWDWDWRPQFPAGLLTGYTDVSLGRWIGTRGPDEEYATQLGITPVLRLYPGRTPAGWFVEGGIGLNAISPQYTNGSRRFSTVLNFGSHVGVGRRFGQHQEHEVALRVQHFSNAGISKPNPGENFLQARYVRHF